MPTFGVFLVFLVAWLPSKADQRCSMMDSRLKMLSSGINQLKPGYWIRLNDQPVCFQTRGNSPGKFSSPLDGVVAAVKLVHLYGSVTCDRRTDLHYSYWGCNRHSTHKWKDLNIFLTDNQGRQLLSDKPDSTFGWFNHELFSPNSKEFVFMNWQNPIYVPLNYEFQLWYGDDKQDRNEDMSQGETCVDVYAHFV